MASQRAVQQTQQEPLFHVRHGNQVGHGGITLTDLRQANPDDEDLLGWADAAAVGSSLTSGGGAAPKITVRRVA